MDIIKIAVRSLLVCFLMVVSGCAAVKLGSIQPPAETARLRVAVLTASGVLKQGAWGRGDDEFRFRNTMAVARHLRSFGAFEVVRQRELAAVLGDQQEFTSWQLSRNNFQFARDIGKALYADYVFIGDRGTLGDPHYYYETTLLNVVTGAKYAVRINNTRAQKPGSHKLPPDTGRIAFRELFRDAKGDLLATALRKSRRLQQEKLLDHKLEEETRQKLYKIRVAEQRAREEAERSRIEAARIAQEKSEAARMAAEKAAREKAEAERLAVLKREQELQLAREAERVRNAEQERRLTEEQSRKGLERARIAAEKTLGQATRQVIYGEVEKKELAVKGLKKLIVYDLIAPESLNVPALILSEAMREEILKRGRFDLVNRENMAQIIEELKFQQSGLVDPNQAVKLGKGAGANQIVTGKLGPIGQSLMLQSKRTEVETMLNLSAASLKGQVGQEDELLDKLPGLVDRLLSGK